MYVYYLLSSDDALQEIKEIIMKNYMISNFDNEQLCKCLMLFIAMQGGFDSAWSSLGARCLIIF